MSADKYEQDLAAWKARHGITKPTGEALTAEDIMAAEDAKSDGTDYCWQCAEEFPIRDMIIETSPYLQDDDAPRAEDGYIPKKYRVRSCKPCHQKAESDED